MRMIDCSIENLSITELLRLAIKEHLFLQDSKGQKFVLAPVDDFQQEVELLGNSERFMAFLEERSKEKARYSLEEVKKRLDLE